MKNEKKSETQQRLEQLNREDSEMLLEDLRRNSWKFPPIKLEGPMPIIVEIPGI